MDGKRFVSRLQREDGQAWNYILDIILVALVLGFLIFQFGPIVWNHISIHGTADDAAEEAVIAYRNSKGNMDRVARIVNDLIQSRDARLVTDITLVKGVNGEPDMITVQVRKIVNTYLFENVGYLCRYTEAQASSERPLR